MLSDHMEFRILDNLTGPMHCPWTITPVTVTFCQVWGNHICFHNEIMQRTIPLLFSFSLFPPSQLSFLPLSLLTCIYYMPTLCKALFEVPRIQLWTETGTLFLIPTWTMKLMKLMLCAPYLYELFLRSQEWNTVQKYVHLVYIFYKFYKICRRCFSYNWLRMLSLSTPVVLPPHFLITNVIWVAEDTLGILLWQNWVRNISGLGTVGCTGVVCSHFCIKLLF